MEQLPLKSKRDLNDPLTIFVSYSHIDEELKNKLMTHLTSLKREGLIKPWSDRDIILSEEWKAKITTQLDTADIILLLISPDFIASDFIWDVELKRAMERDKAGEARVVPIILRPTDFSRFDFAGLQAAPTNALPVTRWGDIDIAFNDVAIQLRHLVEEMKKNRQ